ncbi:MAG: hypothetical protein VXW22_07095, partial [Pseudomonadota bacterium]|nr:hypothetical protein [Pseudomonadota bacterium]
QSDAEEAGWRRPHGCYWPYGCWFLWPWMEQPRPAKEATQQQTQSEIDAYKAETDQYIAETGRYGAETDRYKAHTDRANVNSQIDERNRKAAEGAGSNAKGFKPSAEMVGRLATGLPNVISGIDTMVGMMSPGQEKKGWRLSMSGINPPTSGKGYRPGHDWGGRFVSGIPDFGLLEPIAKVLKGKDGQQFDQAWYKFESAVMPIMSGAAVTDSEAERLINALKPEINDSDEIVMAKLQGMENVGRGLVALQGGDYDGFMNLINSNIGDLGIEPIKTSRTQSSGAGNLPDVSGMKMPNGDQMKMLVDQPDLAKSFAANFPELTRFYTPEDLIEVYNDFVAEGNDPDQFGAAIQAFMTEQLSE